MGHADRSDDRGEPRTSRSTRLCSPGARSTSSCRSPTMTRDNRPAGCRGARGRRPRTAARRSKHTRRRREEHAALPRACLPHGQKDRLSRRSTWRMPPGSGRSSTRAAMAAQTSPRPSSSRCAHPPRIYYLAAMQAATHSSARRMVILASEDIGNADPARLVAVAAPPSSASASGGTAQTPAVPRAGHVETPSRPHSARRACAVHPPAGLTHRRQPAQSQEAQGAGRVFLSTTPGFEADNLPSR